MTQRRIEQPLFTTGKASSRTKEAVRGNEACPHDTAAINAIYALNQRHEIKHASQMRVESALNRPLVSFQANKQRAVYRWCKYKEGFSAGLVEYFLDRYDIHSGALLDPFAGSGTALFATSARGLHAEGIELLPIGQRIIAMKQVIDELTSAEIDQLAALAKDQPWIRSKAKTPLHTLRITKGAYPPETVQRIEQFTAFTKQQKPNIAEVLTFALLCILESISYTRKDGQYLRWDHRSGRRHGKKVFDKGKIQQFDTAITAKLAEMISDVRSNGVPTDLFGQKPIPPGPIILHSGSCLQILPRLSASRFDCIITSPPYCNRYDYTRTYALELAYLGVSEEQLVELRQAMVSCTVENREKDLLRMNRRWKHAVAVANEHLLLQAVLSYLDSEKEHNRLNNNGIPRMVRGYFYEMACVIQECARVLKPYAPLIMVNDNVRYAGVSISVDIILSEFAEALGFTLDTILILPNGKGNSSQQMGLHGRDPLRKCVYIWRKSKSE
jgi:DNA modification methylase